MMRFEMICLAGALLLVGCDKSAQDNGSNPNAASSSTKAAGSSLPTNFMETAKAEALKVFRTSWTNADGVWTSYIPQRKRRVQLTNLTIRVEPVELTEKQLQSGVHAGAEVYFDAKLARNNSARGKWGEWKPTSSLRYPVLESNGVWQVENNYRKSFVLPPAQESTE